MFVPKHWNKVSKVKPGDICIKSNHIMIYLGGGLVANAHHNSHGGTYGIIEKRSTSGFDKYRPKKKVAIEKGDVGTNVKNLQKFLNWYGNYGLKVDGEFGTDTYYAVRDFKTKEGLAENGKFGKKALEKAKKVKR